MDEDNPITRALAAEAVERLIEQVRKDRDRWRHFAYHWQESPSYARALFREYGDEADATLKLALGREEEA